jgi:hypothetical protein
LFMACGAALTSTVFSFSIAALLLLAGQESRKTRYRRKSDVHRRRTKRLSDAGREMGSFGGVEWRPKRTGVTNQHRTGKRATRALEPDERTRMAAWESPVFGCSRPRTRGEKEKSLAAGRSRGVRVRTGGRHPRSYSSIKA